MERDEKKVPPVRTSTSNCTSKSVKPVMCLIQSLKKPPAALRWRFHTDHTESLSHGDPLFKVHYLGTEKIFSLHPEQAEEAIARLLSQAQGRMGKEHALVVRPRYVEVKEISTSRQLTKTYLKDIAFCTADPARPNVFLYICRQHGLRLQCHVFWCSRAKRTRDLTACLAHSFQRALNEWQAGASSNLQQEAVDLDKGQAGRENNVTV